MSYNYDLLGTRFRGYCSNLPTDYMSSDSDTDVQSLISGAWASARDAEQNLIFIKNTVENNKDLSINQASEMMKEYAYSNVLNSKNILSILSAIRAFEDVTLPCHHYSSNFREGYQALTVLARALLPYIGLYNAGGNTHEEAAENLSHFSNDVTLCYCNGRPVKMNIELWKPDNCYVSRSNDDQYEIGSWNGNGTAKSGSMSISLYNLNIFFGFTVRPNADPEFVTNQNKLFWKPLKSEILIEPTGYSIEYSNSSTNENVICFAIDNSSTPSNFVTIDTVEQDVATASGFYTSICDVLDAALTSPVSMPVVSIYNKLNDYQNDKVQQFKDRFLGYEYMPLRSVLSTVCGTLQDTYATQENEGYSTISSNPNFISNVIQITVETIISIVLTVLSLVLTIISRVLGIIMMVISSIISAVQQNTHVVQAEIDHTSEMPTFNVATQAWNFKLSSLDQANTILSTSNQRELSDRILTYGIGSTGMLTPDVAYDDSTIKFVGSPTTRSRLIDLIYSNGYDLFDTDLPVSGKEKVIQYAFAPSVDGGIYLPSTWNGNNQVTWTQNSSGNTLASKLSSSGEVKMTIPASTDSELEWYVYDRPKVNYSDVGIYNYSDARLAYEFGMGVAEWAVRCFLISQLNPGETDYRSNILSPSVSDGSNPLPVVGLPSYSNETSITSSSTWRHDLSKTMIDDMVDNATGQFASFITNSSAYKSALLALSFILFHKHSGSLSASWDDVINLFNSVKGAFTYEKYGVGLFRQILREGGLWSCPMSGYEALNPAFLLPNVSKKSLIISLVLTGVIVAASAVATVLVKRGLKKGAVKLWHKSQSKYNNAVEAYNNDPTSSNLNALYKANKKLGRSGKLCSLMGVKSVGGWDPGGFYSTNSSVPKQTDQMPLTEYLVGPYASQLSTNLANYTAEEITGSNVEITTLIRGY